MIHIGSMLGLLALISLIPLILLYLIRPKPQTIEIPSLMFFIQSSGRNKLSSFFKKFIRDWLFLIQLLIILLLALSIAKPFTNYQHDITAQNTVIVLDASASMQALEGQYSRFDKAKDKAKQMLGAKNTIILAKEVPSIVVKEATSAEAAKYLNKAQPTESTSRIGDSIILAGEALGSEGAVIVLSDFINTGGQDPNIAKSILESKGLVVNFVNVAEKKASNIGIINIEADREEATVYVKNFDDTARFATLKVGDVQKELNLGPKSSETFTFKTPNGITQMMLVTDDDFKIDNLAYLSAPETEKTKAALVTNNASVFLKNALEASGDVQVTVIKPPVVPVEGYDVYILHNLDMNEVLPGTFDALYYAVQNGANVVVHVQEDSNQINYKNLLPLKLTGKGNGGFVGVEQLNKFTKNIDFGSITSHFTTTGQEQGFTTIVSLGNDTIISLGKAGSGKLVYYGIPESTADFKYSPSYPIFWTEMLRYLTGQLDLKNLNYLTKDTVILDSEQTIKTPIKTVKQATIMLESSGVYELEDKRIAANLLDEKESEINAETIIGAKSTQFELKPVKETRKLELEPLLILAAGLIILLEIMYIKIRGDV
ncbi:BatA domain-containing protein [Candidatus Woesearchaeota archaeon]|nr:BatA domain-containing protein [Candidatus Woesearchaeota archaeon]MBW3005321.1 BatA domain-containing protein [Candidatus Woesearchaeota archaeon]